MTYELFPGLYDHESEAIGGKAESGASIIRPSVFQEACQKNLRKIEIQRLEAEEARLEAAIKLAIGSAKGMEGVAIWETGDSRRVFNNEALRAVDPELYEIYLTKFDQTRFRMERPDEYASFQQTKRVRNFRLIEGL
jgi:hypothetical protein